MKDIEDYANAQEFPMDAAKKFFLEKSSVGWVDRNGRPIRDWRPALEAYATAWKDIDSRKPTHNPTRIGRSHGVFGAIASATDFTSTKI